MDKINFQNLPSTTTPLSAQNLNQLQTNVENAIKDAGVVVSATEPSSSNKKRVWKQHSKNLLNNRQPKTYSSNCNITSLSTGIRAISVTGVYNTFACIDIGALKDYVGKKIYVKFTNSSSANTGRVYIGKSTAGQSSRSIISDTGPISNGSHTFETNTLVDDTDKPRLFIAIYSNGSSGTTVAENSYIDYTNLIVSTEDVSYEPYVNDKEYVLNNNNQYDEYDTNNTIVSVSEPTGKNRKKVWLQHSKNLFNKNKVNKIDGYIDTSTQYISTSSSGAKCLYIPCKNNATYTITKLKDTSNNRFRAGFTNELPALTVRCNPFVSDDNKETITITGDSTSKYLVVYYYTTTFSLTEQQMLDSIQIEEGSTNTSYENYVDDKEYILNDNNIYENFEPQNNIYNLAETKIGTFLGKPLYRKVIDFGALPNASQANVNHGISSLGQVVNISGVAYTSSTRLPIPTTGNSNISSGLSIAIAVYNSTLRIATNNDATSFNAYVVLEYTKTTD